MGFADKIKGLVGKNKKQVNQGIDKTADVVAKKVGHADQIEKGAEQAKKVVDKLD